jgi:hypothetical protein
MQTISITAEDSRFVPELVRVNTAAPLTLSVYNAGREDHEFVSHVLTYASENRSDGESVPAALSNTILRPGQSLRVVLTAPSGTYLYFCRRKGHPNMTGTLIIE